jgi:CheY-like chemotaxis protein
MSAEPRSDAPPDGAKPADDSWRDLSTDPPAPPTGERSAAVALGRLRDLRVFVVAADPARRASLARALDALRLGVESGPPDGDGYRAALAFQPDAIVSELTRPGEPGWWLLQRLRRHPLLRWTPVLLMRWWKDDQTASAPEVLMARVVDNLAEALTPLRVLEERVAAGRPLGDRVENTGPLPLLKVLCGAGLTGALAINDGWSAFDIDLVSGRPVAAARRAAGSTEVTTGEDALFQAALCDFGRWTFRAHTAPPGKNLDLGLAELADRIGRRAALVFGPDAAFGPGADPRLGVRVDRLRELAAKSAGLERQVCAAVAGGASGDELDSLLRAGEDRPVVERIAIGLLRCGALQLLGPGEPAEPREDTTRVVRSAAHVLAWLAADHRPAARADGRGPEPKPITSTGYYQVAPTREEKIALGPAEGIVAAGAWRPSMTADLAPGYHHELARDERPAFADTPAAPPRRDDSPSWPRHPDDPLVAGEPRALPLLHDSLVPSPTKGEERGGRQKWIALGLAILLGALLIAGLAVLGASEREPPAPPADSRR